EKLQGVSILRDRSAITDIKRIHLVGAVQFVIFAVGAGDGFKSKFVFQKAFPGVPDLAFLFDGEKSFALGFEQLGFAADKLDDIRQAGVAARDDLGLGFV